MTGHRMSILPIAQFCGQAPILSAKYGAGRPAAMGSAFHAKCEGSPKAAAMLAALTDVERAEVDGWQFPVNVIYAEGCVLDYQSAEKEVAVGLDEWGWYADPDGDCLAVGHLDMGWVKELSPGYKVAFVGDYKKTIYTTQDGPDSLQLQAYGWAYAQKNQCQAFATGLWCATEGEWLWSKEMIELDSDRGRAVWEKIAAAASNKGEASTGVHCRSCWARLHCPEHLLPAALADTWLAPVANGTPTGEQAAEMLLKGQAFEELWDKAKKNLQEMVRRGAVRVERDGKLYAPVQMSGRKSVDTAALKAALGEKAEAFMRQGAPYDQFRWIKA